MSGRNPGILWTPKVIQAVREERGTGTRIKVIARRLDVCPSAVANALWRGPSPNCFYTEEEVLRRIKGQSCDKL